MSYTVNETMMRINLAKPLAHGEKIALNIKWNYNINNYMIDWLSPNLEPTTQNNIPC